MNDLKEKKICRFCLTQKEPLVDIFSNKESQNSKEITLQIMAMNAISVEIFPNDNMPRKACHSCMDVIKACFAFRQSCKKAETLLKLYPLTGVLPESLQISKDIVSTLKTFHKQMLKNVEQMTDEEPPSPKPKPFTIPKKSPEKKVATPPSTSKQTIWKNTSKPEMSQSLEAKDPLEIQDSRETRSAKNKSLEVASSSQTQKETAKKSDSPVIKKIVVKNQSKQEKMDVSVNFSSQKTEKMDVSTVISQNKKSASMGEDMDVDFEQSQTPTQVEAKQNIVETAANKPIILNTMIISGKIETLGGEIEEEEEQFELAEIEDEVGEDHSKENDTNNTNGDSDLKCPECDKVFALRQLLDIHVDNHHRDRNFPCPVCEKAFFRKGDLVKHMVIHTGEKNFVCVVCEKGFSRYALLARHEQLKHKDLPKYKCEECERNFLCKDYYEDHMKTHEKQRFMCNICLKKFAYKQGLERHVATMHEEENYMYNCEVCDEQFTSIGKLEVHLKKHMKAVDPVEEKTEIIGTFIVENNMLKPIAEQSPEKSSEKTKRNTSTEIKQEPAKKRKIVEEKSSPEKAKNKVQSVLNKLPKDLMVKVKDNQNVASTSSNAKATAKPSTTLHNYFPKQSTETTPDKTAKAIKKEILSPPLTQFKEPPVILNQIQEKPKILKQEIVKQPEASKPSTSEAFQPGSQSTPKQKPVRIERIKMTKAQINALIAEGKIEMKNGNLVMKKK